MKPAVEAADQEAATRSSVHVDDVAQEAEGDEDAVVASLQKAGSTFVTQMQRQGQVMSRKSVVVATSISIAVRLAKYFQKVHGVSLLVAPCSDHLGILRGNGKTTPFSTL